MSNTFKDDCVVFDIEADGIIPTKIHCLVYEKGGKFNELSSYKDMASFLKSVKILVGHNIIRYDIPALERILNISIKSKLVDTLALSWYLEPKRYQHGLADYGEDYGIPKPVVEDWENQPLEVYLNRCKEDVKINSRLWNTQWKKLVKLYESDVGATRLINYLTFKMDCIKEQEQSMWRFNEEYCKESLKKLQDLSDEKTELLVSAMPAKPIIKEFSRPAKPFKQDGSRSVSGDKWFKILEEECLPEDYSGTVTRKVGEEKSNPSSHKQIKEWLDSLGWEPKTFKYKRDKETSEVTKIPQVSVEGGEVCSSVKSLYKKEPKLRELEEYFVLKHRVSILKGFLRDNKGGYLQATVSGITNTMRFKHKCLVNLPGVDKLYGKQIRGCLIAPEGLQLCGSDMSSLEDRCKQHYIYKYDPDYVREMSAEGYDPHTSLAVFSKAMTKEEERQFKNGEGDIERLKVIRKAYKGTNYASVYGIGGESLSRQLSVSKREADKMLEAYWKKNFSVKKVAEDVEVKVFDKKKWLFNPVSKLWYTLRAEKDRFSTLNQGTGTYVFDCWVREVRKTYKIIGQFHDEIIFCTKSGEEDKAVATLKDAIKSVNSRLKLNRDMDIDIEFGNSYAEIH